MKEALVWILDFGWADGFSGWQIRACYMAFFLAVLIVALRQKRSFVYEGAPDQKTWRDLRIWAAVVMAIQAALYALL